MHFNPSTWEEDRQISEFKASQVYIMRSSLRKKKRKKFKGDTHTEEEANRICIQEGTTSKKVKGQVWSDLAYSYKVCLKVRELSYH